MKNIFVLFISTFFATMYVSAQDVRNYPFATHNSITLSMDVYSPEHLKEKNPVVIFMFGGGFTSGSKQDKQVVGYCKALASKGYIVAAIDYRLGMKGVSGGVLKLVRPLEKAIDMAVEDLFSATNYLLEHATELKVDPECIIINGSSAGAISVLQADYELSNRTELASVLPADFKYAGVISFAGAVLSFKGKPKYKDTPAPTCFFHGTQDKLVFYNKKQFFNIGLFGTNSLVKRFKKSDSNYWVYRFDGLGHEVAGLPMQYGVEQVQLFIEKNVIEKTPLRLNTCIKDKDWKFSDAGSNTPKELYK